MALESESFLEQRKIPAERNFGNNYLKIPFPDDSAGLISDFLLPDRNDRFTILTHDFDRLLPVVRFCLCVGFEHVRLVDCSLQICVIVVEVDLASILVNADG